jgi:hypothetical protein
MSSSKQESNMKLFMRRCASSIAQVTGADHGIVSMVIRNVKDQMTCTHLLQSGPREGEACGRFMCGRHRETIVESESESESEPESERVVLDITGMTDAKYAMDEKYATTGLLRRVVRHPDAMDSTDSEDDDEKHVVASRSAVYYDDDRAVAMALDDLENTRSEEYKTPPRHRISRTLSSLDRQRRQDRRHQRRRSLQERITMESNVNQVRLAQGMQPVFPSIGAQIQEFEDSDYKSD